MKSNNVDAVIFRPYPLQVCLLSFVIKFLAITKCLKSTNHKPFFFSFLFFFVLFFLSGVASGTLFTVSCGSSPQLFFSIFFSSFLAWRRKRRSFGSHFVYAGTVQERKHLYTFDCLWLLMSYPSTILCVCMYVSCHYPVIQWGCR